MFGDYGHGSLLLFMGTCLVLFDDYIKKTDLAFARPFRYLFFMMGFFSCYNGLLYNEWFAIPYPWFNSCYVTDEIPKANHGYVWPYVDFPTSTYLTGQYDGTICVYPFGMDPTWFLSSNDILVVQDSMKMKISVIIGVLHMSMGIFTKGLNQLYFGNRLVFWTEVVTGMIILNGLFGWMDMLIIIKWFYPMNPYSTDKKMQDRINQAPSIITVMINNFLNMGKQPFVEPSGKTKEVYLIHGQREISETLVVIVLLMIPIMLCVKPCSAVCCPTFSGQPEYDSKNKQVVNADNDASNPNYEQPIISIQTGVDQTLAEEMQIYQDLLKEEGVHHHDLNELFIH